MILSQRQLEEIAASIMQPQASAKKKTTGGNGMWLGLALLSALFAALTSILAKVGIEGVDVYKRQGHPQARRRP